jgi:serine/threonine protein kinase/formylglycine-generating enzyme required for sulfatase activity
MNADDWRIIQALFLDTLEIPPAERESYLAASGEPEPILAEVRIMLVADETGAGFAEPPSPEMLAKSISPANYLEGTKLGDFELFEELGRGGMGIVYRAKQVSLNRDVAIKVLPPALAASKLRLARFHREALAASKLDHPGVAPVLAFGEDQGIVFYAMKLVEGPTLQSILKSAKAGQPTEPSPGDAPSCARFIHALLEGIAHIHDHHILHRDIKPANILCGSGEPTLIDFGLAKDLELSGITETGDVAGSPHYMSPEQVVALTAGIDERTDVYSAGAVLFEMLTLKTPFAGSAVPDIFHKIQEEVPPGLRKIDASLSKDLETIVSKALEKDPADRYASAQEMADDLAAFLAGNPIAARPVSFSRRARSSATKKRSLLRIGPALLIFGGLFGTWAYQQNYGPEALAQAAMPRLSIHANGEDGAKVWAYLVSSVDQSLSETIDLGELGDSDDDLLEVSLAEGDYRIVVQAKDGRFSEFRRNLKPNQTATITPALTQDAMTPNAMVAVPGGVAKDVGYMTQAAGDEGLSLVVIDVPVKPFWVDEAAVTNRQFAEFLKQSGHKTPTRWLRAKGESMVDPDPLVEPVEPKPAYEDFFADPPREDWLDLPVVLINWFDAQAYAEFYDMRLPTLAEQLWFGSRCHEDWLALPEDQRLLRINLAAEGSLGDMTTFQQYLDLVQPSRQPEYRIGLDGLYHPIGNVMEWSMDMSSFGEFPDSHSTFGLHAADPASGYQDMNNGAVPGQFASPMLGFRCARSQSFDS